MTDTGPLFVSTGDLVSDRRYKAAVELAARGDFAGAADVLTQTVEAAPGFATAWFALGAIRDRLGDRDAAVTALRAASGSDPDDYHGARLQLARLGAGPEIPAMTEPYLRRLFDQYAGRYDAALIEHLHYRGPALLRDAVTSALQRMGRSMQFGSLLDLGCGTGLAGEVFRPFAGRLVGVDLAAAMIARAETKGDYDRLVVGNLAAFLSDEMPKPRNTIWCWRPMCSSTSTTLLRCSPLSLACWRRAACSPSRSRHIPARALRCCRRCASPTASAICAMRSPARA